MDFILRLAVEKDITFLWEMLYEAVFGNYPDKWLTIEETFAKPAIYKILDDWGRCGDTVVVAEILLEGQIGAAWYLHWTKENHSFDFVDEIHPRDWHRGMPGF